MGYWVVLAVPVIAVVVWVIASPGSGVPQFPVEPEPAVEVPEPPPLPPVESLSPAEPLTPPLPELPIAQGESGTPDASAEAAGEPGPVATPAVPTEPVAEEAAQEAPGPGTGIALLPASGDDLLRMRFLEASWVEVLDADERQLYYGLVEPGSIQEVRGRAPFDLRLGNAPGVEVEMNGNEVDLAPRTRSDNTARLRLQ
jgi:cytoskeleton protein RodZ